MSKVVLVQLRLEYDIWELFGVARVIGKNVVVSSTSDEGGVFCVAGMESPSFINLRFGCVI